MGPQEKKLRRLVKKRGILKVRGDFDGNLSTEERCKIAIRLIKRKNKGKDISENEL